MYSISAEEISLFALTCVAVGGGIIGVIVVLFYEIKYAKWLRMARDFNKRKYI